MEEFQKKWDEIKELLRLHLGLIDLSYNTWIKPLKIHNVSDNTLTICVPNEISEYGDGVGFIIKRYKKPLSDVINEIMKKEYELLFLSEKEINNGINTPSGKVNNNFVNDSNRLRVENANLNYKYTFDTFVVGENNRFAHSAALAVSEAPGDIYNPLFIWGGPGLGKTHLMHSIGHFIISQNPNLNVLYVTSEKFTNEVIESIRSGGSQSMVKLREKYRNIDVLLIDDIQFIIGKESTQIEFFNTFNELQASKKAIVISSDRPPKDLETLEERMRSRFEGGLIADIKPPNYETRMAILRKNAENIGCNIDDEIIQYIANNIKSNVRVLEGAFNKVVALSNMNRDDKITLSTAEEAIRDLINPADSKIISNKLILDTVANFYGVSTDDIVSKKRLQDIVLPRQVVMYLCNKICDTNTVAIGKLLGGRDHTTIIYGIDKINSLIKNNDEVASSIDKIMKLLNQ